MVVEHAHGLRQRRGPNAKSSLHKAHLAPDAGLQAPGASLSFAQGSHDFESLDRGIGRGDRFETAHRLDQYLELRSEEHTSELQSLMRISYAVFCLQKQINITTEYYIITTVEHRQPSRPKRKTYYTQERQERGR